jgi:hypothetical protein
VNQRTCQATCCCSFRQNQSVDSLGNGYSLESDVSWHRCFETCARHRMGMPHTTGVSVAEEFKNTLPAFGGRPYVLVVSNADSSPEGVRSVACKMMTDVLRTTPTHCVQTSDDNSATCVTYPIPTKANTSKPIVIRVTSTKAVWKQNQSLKSPLKRNQGLAPLTRCESHRDVLLRYAELSCGDGVVIRPHKPIDCKRQTGQNPAPNQHGRVLNSAIIANRH